MHELIWLLDPLARVSFEAAPRRQHAFFTSSFELVNGTWMYALTLVIVVPTLGSRAARILFTDERPNDPNVHVFDPFWSPHRSSDGSLCMWHPRDARAQRWLHIDGLPALIGHIQAHLVREDWRRRMGEGVRTGGCTLGRHQRGR